MYIHILKIYIVQAHILAAHAYCILGSTKTALSQATMDTYM
jgi:hypothetical protein